MKANSVVIITMFDLGLYLNAVTVSLVWGFFFKNSLLLRYLGVVDGRKLSFPVEKQHLGLICLFYFRWMYWVRTAVHFLQNELWIWAFCKSGLCQTLNFDSVDIAFTMMWPCRIPQQQLGKSPASQAGLPQSSCKESVLCELCGVTGYSLCQST